MSSKGGRTSTTWDNNSTWRSGKTKTIRVPEALASQVMAYARQLDKGIDQRINISIAVSHGNRGDAQDIILSAIAAYTDFKTKNYHPNQHSKILDTNTRAWDELRRFRRIVQTAPEKLGLNSLVNENSSQ